MRAARFSGVHLVATLTGKLGIVAAKPRKPLIPAVRFKTNWRKNTMPDMPWKEAIIKVLNESDTAMHYSDIAEQVVESGLRKSVGATPAATVNAYIGTSLNDEGIESPFIRVGRGEYFLRAKSTTTDEPVSHDQDTGVSSEAEEQREEPEYTAIIHAFGMFWQRELVLWSNSPSVLGRQQIGADPVDFSDQIGVYLLHDWRDVVYVGRSINRPLGRRLYEHTQDRLRGRWDRFSWFGLLSVTEEGRLEEKEILPTVDTIISTLEALLIEGLEPTQNRKRGDDFNAIEYLQAEDPEIEKQQMKKLLAEMQTKLSQ